MSGSHVGHIVGFVALAVCGCSSGPDVSLSGTVDQRSFVARDAFFDVGTHVDIDTNSTVTFTELRFTDYADGCAQYGGPSEPPPFPNLEVTAALYTMGTLAPANGQLDSSVHAPINFALASVSGALAFGSWLLTTTHSGDDESFDGGTIEITSVTDDALAGSVDMTSTAGDVVTGTFTAPLCAAAGVGG